MTRLLTRVYGFNGRIRFQVTKNSPTCQNRRLGTLASHSVSVTRVSCRGANRLEHNVNSFVMTYRMGGAVTLCVMPTCRGIVTLPCWV